MRAKSFLTIVVIALAGIAPIGCVTRSIAQSPATQPVHEAAVLYVPPPRMATLTEEPANAAAKAPIANDAVWNRTIATHAALLGNPTRLAAVLADPNRLTLKTNWYSRFKNRAEATAWLALNTHVSQIAGTALIEVSVTGDVDANDAAVIANDIVSRYLDDNRKRESDKLVAQVSLLQNLKARYDNQIRSLKLEISAKLTARAGTSTTQPAADEEIETLREEQNAYQSLADRFRNQLDAINMAIMQTDMAGVVQVVYPGDQAAR